MALLHITSLRKQFPQSDDRAVLENTQLEVSPGERVAILGRSGCGKSTLLNLVAGLENPDSGDITLGDTNLTHLSDNARARHRRRHIGFIFQFFNLVPTLTALENILLPLQLNRLDMADNLERAYQLLEELGISSLAHRFPEKLSGGEQQRVAIARALVHEPSLILADEPTGNLDQETGNQVAELLFSAVNKNTALLLVTHSEEIAERADRTLRLQRGQLWAT